MPAPAKTPKTIEERTTPYPPRFRWLRRLISLFVFLIIAVVILRLWWGHAARQRLQAEIDAIHARGEPILIEDFVQPSIPDKDNAAWYLTQAERVYVSSKAVDDAVWAWDQKTTPENMAIFRQYLLSNAAAMQWIRAARDKPAASWNAKITSPIFLMLLPHLNPQRELCDLLHLNAYTMHQDQHDAQAIESIRDNLRLAGATGQGIPNMVTHLVEGGMIAAAAGSVLDSGYDLQIDPVGTTRPTGPAGRQQVLSLIGELLDDHAFNQNLTRDFYGERLFVYDSVVNYIGGQRGQYRLVTEFLQPKIDLSAVQLMRTVTKELQASTQPDYPDVMTRMPDTKQEPSLVGTIDQLLGEVLGSNSNRAILAHFRIESDRRAAAIALAVRLWQVDHGGKFPPNLEALVPVYLPAIPIDPFAKSLSPFRYKSDTPAGPIIYSVGENDVDDGGSVTPLPAFAKHINPDDRHDRLDIVYPLRPPPPSSETGDNGVNQ